ncbi:MAG: NapC/NirT family cytochrome c [Myxococcaceae bacterium]|nr:NapC/NirT family cytochrome c [Myxococcaceae bacterium]
MGSAATPFGALALATAAIAAALLVHHLVARPPLTLATRLRLLLGLAVFPFLCAVATTGSGMQRTTEREFCGSCHVMGAHLKDVEDPTSTSLASRHARNPMFGGHACYTCHADYGMLGYPMTKLTGMGHVWYYYGGGYRDWPLEKFLAEVRIAKPFPNANCRQCHSGTLTSFRDAKEHRAMAQELEQNRVSCASAGCHGVAHPFNKRPEEL